MHTLHTHTLHTHRHTHTHYTSTIHTHKHLATISKYTGPVATTNDRSMAVVRVTTNIVCTEQNVFKGEGVREGACSSIVQVELDPEKQLKIIFSTELTFQPTRQLVVTAKVTTDMYGLAPL